MADKLYSFASTVFLMLLTLVLVVGFVITWLKYKAPRLRKADYVQAFDTAFLGVTR